MYNILDLRFFQTVMFASHDTKDHGDTEGLRGTEKYRDTEERQLTNSYREMGIVSSES